MKKRPDVSSQVARCQYFYKRRATFATVTAFLRWSEPDQVQGLDTYVLSATLQQAWMAPLAVCMRRIIHCQGFNLYRMYPEFRYVSSIGSWSTPFSANFCFMCYNLS